MTDTAFLSEVEAFMTRTGVAPSRLGREINDPAFVLKLRRGRRVWGDTKERVRAAMARLDPA